MFSSQMALDAVLAGFIKYGIPALVLFVVLSLLLEKVRRWSKAKERENKETRKTHAKKLKRQDWPK